METPIEDISTTHSKASRPKNGANDDKATVKSTAIEGVRWVGCTLSNIAGRIFALPIANNNRLPANIKPFNPVKIPIQSAIANNINPNGPNKLSITKPVPHKCPAAATSSQGL